MEEKKKGRGRPKTKPAKTVAIRLDVPPPIAIEFRRLAAKMAEPGGSSGLAVRLVEAAVTSGLDGTISLKQIRSTIDAEYKQKVEGAADT